MKVLVMTDLEGVSGVVSFAEQTYVDAKYCEQAKKLLTEEVNAAIEGLVEEDVEDILVIDGHGPGGIDFESLHPAAKLMHGRPVAPRKVRNEIFKEYDVSIMIGQHAMAGSCQGNLSHTQNSKMVAYYKLNGEYIGEIAQWALYCGTLGLPIIFLSGDDAACKEAQELISGVITAEVKQGLSRSSAISMSAKKSKEIIREKVKLAVRNHLKEPIKPIVWEGPFVLDVKYHSSEAVDTIMSYGRSWEIVDAQTVRLQANEVDEIINSYGFVH